MTHILVIGTGLIGADLIRRVSDQFPAACLRVRARSTSAVTRQVLSRSGAQLTESFDPPPGIATRDVVVDASDAAHHLEHVAPTTRPNLHELTGSMDCRRSSVLATSDARSTRMRSTAVTAAGTDTRSERDRSPCRG